MREKTEMITKKQAAELLGVTSRTIDRRVAEGHFRPYYEVGKTRSDKGRKIVLFDKCEIIRGFHAYNAYRR